MDVGFYFVTLGPTVSRRSGGSVPSSPVLGTRAMWRHFERPYLDSFESICNAREGHNWFFCTMELGVIISVVYLALFSPYTNEGSAPPGKFHACLFVGTNRRRWKDA